MRSKSTKIIALAVSCAMILAGLPMMVFGQVSAANNQNVITGGTHSIGDVSVNGKNITITVPYKYENKVNVNNFAPAWDSSVTDYSITWNGDAEGVDVGSSITGTASYKVTGDATNSVYSSTYTVKIESEPATQPTVSGSINISATAGKSASIGKTNVEGCYTQNDGKELASVAITLKSDSTGGKIQLNGSDYSLGDKVLYNDFAKLTYLAGASAGTGTYKIAYYESGNNTPIGTADLKVTVGNPSMADVTANSVSHTQTAEFPSAKLTSAYMSASGDSQSFTKIRFTNMPGSATGTLYLGYTNSSNPGTAIKANYDYTYVQLLTGITFVPNSNFTGTATFSVTVYDAADVGYTGMVKFPVTSSDISDITKSIAVGDYYSMPYSQMNTAFRNVSGNKDISYVIFTNASSSSYGNLYGNSSTSSKITNNTTKCYYSKSSEGKYALSSTRFLAESDGTRTLSYTAYDDNGNSFNGKIIIKITSGGDLGLITYSVDSDEVIRFDVDDFKDALEEATSKSLNYVKFTLPASSRGKLYYDYDEESSSKTTVTSSTKYYRTGSSNKLIDDVYFVPNSSYDGNFYIDYVATDTSDNTYDGRIYIKVKGIDLGDLGLISYTVKDQSTKTFSLSDFTKVLAEETSKSLDYVKFTLPSSSNGILYYDYLNANSPGTKVTKNSEYYRTGSNKELISKVTFVPKSGYDGTFYISYTAYDTSDNSYEGKIKMTVTGDGDLSDIDYTLSSGATKKLSASEIGSVLDNKTDYDLDYIKFTSLPSNSVGALYYNYTNASSYDSVASVGVSYYRTGSSNKLINNISFVPKSGYAGTVTIKYTAYDTKGNDFDGEIIIKIAGGSSLGNLTYSVANNSTLKMSQSDINSKFTSLTGGSVYYLKFTLPSTTYGNLYYNYTSASNPGTAVQASDFYYRSTSGQKLIDNVTFVPKSGYTGTFDLYYTAYNSAGASYSGVMKITVTGVTGTGSKYFKDVDAQSYGWVASQVDSLYDGGVVQGTSSNMYSPAANIIRGDFVLMLYRAFGLSANFTENFSDVSSKTYYYNAIGVAKQLGIAQGAYGKFNPTVNLTREDAAVILYRAITITGKKTLTTSTDLSKFSDSSSISDYAKTAVATLVKAGVVNGYENGKFVPKGKLTRAEMAILLYKVLHL